MDANTKEVLLAVVAASSGFGSLLLGWLTAREYAKRKRAFYRQQDRKPH